MSTLLYPPAPVVTLMRRLLGHEETWLRAERLFPYARKYFYRWHRVTKEREGWATGEVDEGVVAKAVGLGLLSADRAWTDEYGLEWQTYVPTERARELHAAKWVVQVIPDPPALFDLPEVVSKARMEEE